MKTGYIPSKTYKKLAEVSHGTDAGAVFHDNNSKTWGKGAAGILVYCPETQEVLLLKRSPHVFDPNTWGIPGGARKQTSKGLESSLITAAKESEEEIGGLPEGRIRKTPYTHHKPGTDFTYDTFILEVSKKERGSFIPFLNWENTGYKWFKLEGLEEEKLLHPGVKELLEHYSLENKTQEKYTLEKKLSVGLILSLSAFILTSKSSLTGNAIAEKIITLPNQVPSIFLLIALICGGILVYKSLFKKIQKH